MTEIESASIGYTSDVTKFHLYKLVIVKSFFFDKEIYGTEKSLPEYPLKNIENIPILYGERKIERQGDTIVLYSDIIASSYFLISRYEEIVKRNIRDKHGRFIGKESVLAKNNYLHRPIVDEYGKLLRKLLREVGYAVEEPNSKIENIYLTHDVDKIAHFRNIKSVGGALIRAYKNPVLAVISLKTFFCGIKYDPWFTFHYLLEQNKLLNKKYLCKIIFFIKTGGGKFQEDKPIAKTSSRDYQYLFNLLKNYDAEIGLHASYEAGIFSKNIESEKKKLEKDAKIDIKYNRHHFLRSCEPEDMQVLIDFGITDDFTMGYADVAGFRLGTCRSVRWINPTTQKLTPLILHPLTIMDGTLNDERYMQLSETAAYNYSIQLIEETKKHGGDLCLLWHNTSVVKNVGYHRRLYENLLNFLKLN
ncbi:MAG: polysaccharide deacetylase family protein [Bacteroidales bacterium]|nr:polysaccharide deacetylase family protein [Bacteroidales bacterium]